MLRNVVCTVVHVAPALSTVPLSVGEGDPVWFEDFGVWPTGTGPADR
jgi:hypothetical protein